MFRRTHSVEGGQQENSDDMNRHNKNLKSSHKNRFYDVVQSRDKRCMNISHQRRFNKHILTLSGTPSYFESEMILISD